jgi:hypothetical protein
LRPCPVAHTYEAFGFGADRDQARHDIGGGKMIGLSRNDASSSGLEALLGFAYMIAFEIPATTLGSRM